MVRDGNIITGGGVTAGIDFALVVAAELAGEDFAQAIQLGIEYAPAPPFNAGRPETAPPAVLAAVQRRMDAAIPKRRADAERGRRGCKLEIVIPRWKRSGGMRGTHEHSRSTVIMGGPDKPGHDGMIRRSPDYL